MENTQESRCKIACFTRQQTINTLAELLIETGAKCVIHEIPDIAGLVETFRVGAADYVICEVNRKETKFQFTTTFWDTLPQNHPPVLLITGSRQCKALQEELYNAGHSNILVTADGESRLFSVLQSFMQGYRTGALTPEGKTNAMAVAEEGAPYAPYDNGERYHFLFSACSDAVITIEMDCQGRTGLLKQINTIACKWLGYAPDINAAFSLKDLFVSVDTARQDEILRNLRTSQEVIFEAAVRGEGDASLPVDVEAKSFPLERGKFQVVLVARRKDKVIPAQEKKSSNQWCPN